MKLSPIVLRIRAANTIFGNLVAGAIELDTALRQTLSREMAFVIDLGDKAENNVHPTGVVQNIIERFAVVCAVRNDDELKQQYGILAYDKLQDVKESLWKILVGWDMAGDYGDGEGVAYQWAEGPVTYAGSRLLDVNRGYAWYQYEFQLPTLVQSYYVDDSEAVQINGHVVSISGLDDLSRIWTQYMFADNVNLKDVVGLPVNTDVVDMEQYFSIEDDPTRGAFGEGFSLGYLLYKGD